MKAARFHLVSGWHVQAPAHTVYEALADLGSLGSWWPGVSATPLAASETVVGRRARLSIRGLVPLALHADVEITAAEPARRIAVSSQGELQGSGEWRLSERSGTTDATFVWDVELEHPVLERLGHPFRPLLVLSHHIVMWRGGRGLRRLLEDVRKPADRPSSIARSRADQ